jgi:hypothetical protein
MLKAPNVTEGEWESGEFSDYGGYDCMTAGVKCGPAFLDGSTYGQDPCEAMDSDDQARMMADAKMLAASKRLAEVLNDIVTNGIGTTVIQNARAALLAAGYTD